MGAKAGAASNDTKAIQSAMDDVGSLIKDLEATIADMKKQQSAINKNPDECAKPAQQLAGELSELSKVVKGADGISKALMKAVAK